MALRPHRLPRLAPQATPSMPVWRSSPHRRVPRCSRRKPRPSYQPLLPEASPESRRDRAAAAHRRSEHVDGEERACRHHLEYARRRHPSLGRHALHRSLSEHFVELSNHTTLLSASPVVHSRHTFESARIRADRALSMATSGFSPTTIRIETKPLEEFSCPFCSNNPAVRPDRAMRGASSPANSPADAESFPQPSFEQVFYCPFAPDSVSKRRRYEIGTANTALTTAFS